MFNVMPHYPGSANRSQGYSPVTLDREWPTMGRLLFIVFCAFFGSILNGFFVAAFFVEHALKNLGNVFHACVGMADMIITAGVMPISAVVLLSGQWDIVPVCQLLQFLTEASTYCYSMFFTLVAVEGYCRVCGASGIHGIYITTRIAIIVILVFLVSFIMAGVGTYLDYDYDYCQRLHYGNIHFKLTTGILFHVIPFVLTSYALIATSIRIRRRALKRTYYKRSQQYKRDSSITNLNITAYLLYVVAWTPYLIVVHVFPDTSDSKYYHSAWFAISRSLVTSFLYNSLNRPFRRAFAHLFYYCCCKSSITGRFDSRHRRAIEYRTAIGEIKVHIMHQAVIINNPHRGASSTRETQEL